VKPATRILSLGLAVYSAAWFVQVIRDGSTLADGVLPGWEAFRAALSPIWPIDGDTYFEGWRGLLSVISAFTNLIVLSLPLWLRLATRHRTARAAVPLWLAAAVDAHWMVGFLQELRWGYFMWCGSFVILAFGVARFAKPAPSLGSTAA
jgi:hypothetical protein